MTYHIYNRANGDENIFREARNYTYFLQQYTKYIEPIADTYAYCLLRNHFHWLVRLLTEEEARHVLHLPASKSYNPTQFFSNFFDSYAKAYNKLYQRYGGLFQRPFGRILVTTDAYFLNLVQYIHFNPQKHGFVSDFREWEYSSYHTLRSDKPTPLQRGFVLEQFNGRAGFEEFHQQTHPEQPIASMIGDDPD
jgi:REP element-mobilizing transposase RayT